jgi:hypothetical protein
LQPTLGGRYILSNDMTSKTSAESGTLGAPDTHIRLSNFAITDEILRLSLFTRPLSNFVRGTSVTYSDPTQRVYHRDTRRLGQRETTLGTVPIDCYGIGKSYSCQGGCHHPRSLAGSRTGGTHTLCNCLSPGIQLCACHPALHLFSSGL